jgi:YggT family protein
MASPIYLVKLVLHYAITLMMAAILGSIIISWLRSFGVRVPYTNPLVRAIEGTADVMLRPIQRHLPTAAGGFDFSPVVAFLLLYILQAVIARL